MLAIALGLGFAPVRSAHAIKDHWVVLRAAGSGAVLGLGAGILSYPFAKSTGTLVTGAVIGALLGTAYGFYLVGQRPTGEPVAWVPNRRDEWAEMSERVVHLGANVRTAQAPLLGFGFSVYQF